VLDVAVDFGAAHAIAGAPALLGSLQADQWNVQGASHRGPLFKLRYGDAAGTELYVSSDNAQAVQLTTWRTRLLGYLGAVPHWLYPTILRVHGELWDRVVVTSALVGIFLTVTGLYVGVARLRRQPNGRWSPYRRWHYWHHLVGLSFGVLTLTWVASGLFTMNPWGFLDSPVGIEESVQVAGTLTGLQITQFLEQVSAFQASDCTASLLQLRGEPLGGKLYVVAVDRDGGRKRLDGQGRPAPLQERELRQALVALPAPVASLVQLNAPDSYYYAGYQRTAAFPVYRVTLRDAAGTTLYLDPLNGRLLDATDTTARQGRWLRTGLHDIDFTATLRQRPLWDVVVLLLLSGVTVGTVTGVWIAFKRIGQDLRRLRGQR
jgi:hypothetical protein